MRKKTVILNLGNSSSSAAASLAVTGTQSYTYPTAAGSATAAITLTTTFPGEKFTMPASAATATFSAPMAVGQEYVMEITGDTLASRVLTLPAGTFFCLNSQTTVTTLTIAQNAKESVRIRQTSSGNYLLFFCPPTVAPTGTGAQVLANSPTLVTPTLGAATATTINGTTIPTSGGDSVMMTGESAFSVFRRFPFWATDLLASQSTGSNFDPFNGAGISSGTAAAASAEPSHPGVSRMSSSASANSGFRIYHQDTALLLGGGEMFECIFNIVTLTELTLRVGFHDATTSADANDGCYLEVPSTGVGVFKTASNGSRTTSSTVHTLLTGTWYRVLIYLDATGANATCTLYDMANVVQGTSRTNSANIPTGAGRFCGCGIIVTELNTGTDATALCDVDYLAFGQTTLRPLSR